jgi:hypothetical protein
VNRMLISTVEGRNETHLAMFFVRIKTYVLKALAVGMVKFGVMED